MERLFSILEYILWKVCVPATYIVFFVPIYGWKLMKRMMHVSFFKTYTCSTILLIAVLILSLWDTENPQTHEELTRDKIVCGGFYLVWTSIMWIEYLKHRKFKGIDKNWVWFPCIAAPILLSGSIELLQHYFSATHSGEWLDWAVDIIGVIISTIFWMGYIGFVKHE